MPRRPISGSEGALRPVFQAASLGASMFKQIPVFFHMNLVLPAMVLSNTVIPAT